MKINKVLFLMVFPLVAEVVISCCPCNYDTQIAHYTIKTTTASNLDNSGSYAVTTDSFNVQRNAYGIRIGIAREKTARTISHTSIFIQSAYALSCDCPPYYEILGRDSIIAIQVFTVNDFDTNHTATSEISDYFKIFSNNSFLTTTDFLKKYSTILYDDRELGWGFDLFLMTPPTANNIQQFRVIITLSDGRILENETIPVNLI